MIHCILDRRAWLAGIRAIIGTAQISAAHGDESARLSVHVSDVRDANNEAGQGGPN